MGPITRHCFVSMSLTVISTPNCRSLGSFRARGGDGHSARNFDDENVGHAAVNFCARRKDDGAARSDADGAAVVDISWRQQTEIRIIQK